MGLFGLKDRHRISSIQAAEASTQYVDIESLLEGRLATADIPGVINSYGTYGAQIKAIYRKYNGREDFGNQQARAIVDIRTAFIAGEGISVACYDDDTAKWIDSFLSRNKLQGSSLLNAIKATEMCGHTLMKLDVEQSDEDIEVRTKRYRYSLSEPFKIVYSNNDFSDDIIAIKVKKNDEWHDIKIDNFVYVRTGGDDSNPDEPTTRLGVVLTDVDNYDRALKDIRRNNHIFARVTPTFEVKTDAEAKALKLWLQKIRWTIGTAFVGSAKFDYKSPSTSAYANLEKELTTTIKTISGTTGVPVHWLGHVDLMSNRATANSLYESIKNATVYERTIWQEAIYDIILKAQELYINSGGNLRLNRDFEVKLPLINFDGFSELVNGLSKAYADEAISIDDYRNQLPGIDTLKTARAVENEKTEAQKRLVKMGLPELNEDNNNDVNEE